MKHPSRCLEHKKVLNKNILIVTAIFPPKVTFTCSVPGLCAAKKEKKTVSLSLKYISTGRCVLTPREAKTNKPLESCISFLFLLAALHGLSALMLVCGLKGRDPCRWFVGVSP